MQTLTANKRSKTDKLLSIRSNGMVPAIVYGALVKENISITVPSVAFGKILQSSGESGTVALEISDNDPKITKKVIDVLIHEIQFDPVKGFPIHIDFLAIDVNKPVEVNVELEFQGISDAEKSGLGVMVKVLHEVEIKALPKNLPHSILVDVSTLSNLNDQIHVKDIVVPPGVTILTDEDEIVALISAVQEIVEEAPVDLASIEVEKKGKKEGEESAENSTADSKSE